MNKADLVTRISKDAEITKREAENALNTFIASVQEVLSTGDSVTLVGLGTFSVKERGARKGRNPRTGSAISIPAQKTLTFKAWSSLREAASSRRPPTRPRQRPKKGRGVTKGSAQAG